MDKNTFGAFEMAIGQLSGNNNQTNSGGRDFPLLSPPMDEDDDVILDDDNSNKIPLVNPDIEPPIVDHQDDDDNGANDDDDGGQQQNEPINPNQVSELGELEPDITAYVKEKLFEKLGWDSNDEEKEFKKVEDIVDYLEEVIELNSKPEYANKEIEDLNSFVKDGGSLRDYFEQLYSEFNLDNIDLNRESHQELVVREQLKEQGYSKEAINKRIQRYSDTGILEDEAKEASEYLVKNKEEKQKKLLIEQTNIQKQVQEQQHQLYNDVSNTVASLEEIKGIKLSKADKDKLVDYIFKPGNDGKTQYQKDYAKSFNNLIESAFFTMKGDSLVKGIKREAQSQATKTLKEKLATKTKFGRNSDSDTAGQSQEKMLGSFSNLMRPQK